MNERFEILAEGLVLPEGPVVMPDGSVIVVELLAGRVTRVWNDKKEVIAEVGGGPNGAQLGRDGALYLCNAGGIAQAGSYFSNPAQPGRIERLDLNTGKHERLYDWVGGKHLGAPNDLIIDADGGIWFTDFGKMFPESQGRGGIYYCKPDGSEIREVYYGGFGYNGIGLSPDGATLYFANTFSARLYRMEITGPGRVAQLKDPPHAPQVLVGASTDDVMLDSLAVTQSGNVCIGTLVNGGITTVSPSGRVSFLAMPDKVVTNIAFGGRDMQDAYITWAETGRLVKTRWDEPGLKLNV